jgi:isoquinoline 1-oxidoreductase beta subunit
MTHDYYRPAVLSRVTAGVNDQGKLVAFDLHIASPSITARFDPTNTNPFDSVIEYAQNFPYAVANFDLRFSRQEIGVDVGYMRSVSHAPNCFAIESAIDELAAVLKRDPLEFRLQLLADKPRHQRVLKVAAEHAGWGRRAPGRYHGIAFMEGYSSCVAQIAEVSVVGAAIKVHRVTCAIDCGQVVNPQIVTAQLESGIVYALSATFWGEITVDNGRIQQQNFNHYRVLRINETPQIDVHLVPSTEAPGGIGETGFPPVAPAVCNALFAATGKRLRSLPIAAHLA